jgi:hypothetical protein
VWRGRGKLLHHEDQVLEVTVSAMYHSILWSLMHSCLNYAQWLLVFYEFCCTRL